MISDVLKLFTNVRSGQKIYADDNVDKLNRSTTVIFLLIAASLIGMNKFFGSQIVCATEGIKPVPVGMDYVNSICFAKDNYHLLDFFGDNTDNNKSSDKGHYPWLFFILVLFALLFYLPYLIWKSFVRSNMFHHLPVDVSGVSNLLKGTCVYKKDDFIKNIVVASQYLDRCFSVNNFNDEYSDDDLNNKHPKLYHDRRRYKIFFHMPLVFKYLFVKVVYLLVSILVFPLAALLLHFDQFWSFFTFGFELFKHEFLTSRTVVKYLNSTYFPRVVLCDVHLKSDSISHEAQYQFQCALPANVFNEVSFISFLYCYFFLNNYKAICL